MNNYIKAQMDNMLQMTKVFVQSCKLAALEDDGQISKDEAKILKQIEEATSEFEKKLKKIK